MRESELESPLQIQIIACLLEGRRTATELTHQIYGSGDRGEMKTDYARVRRELKRLESRGFVAGASLFSRERPYRLTRHGTSSLFGLAGLVDCALLPRKDLLLHLATALLLFALIAIPNLPGWLHLLFAFMSGASTVRVMALLAKTS